MINAMIIQRNKTKGTTKSVKLRLSSDPVSEVARTHHSGIILTCLLSGGLDGMGISTLVRGGL